MANQSMIEGIQVLKNDGIARIHFAHAKQNAFPATHLKALQTAFEEVSNDDSSHVIVLQSDPAKAFCAGASFDELLAVKTPEEGKAFFMGFANVINAMRQCPKPIIGRIHGKAVGGGVGLIAACDYTLATTYAEVKLSEIAIGIGPFVIAPAVLRKIGTSALSELSLAAHTWKSANWAHAKGLLSELHSDFDTLEEAVVQHANRLAAYTPQAVAELKKSLWKGTEDWDNLLEHNAAVSGRLVLSDRTQQTLHQIKSKS
jgi:methylglutaconyl-CoA hydratase